MRARPLLGHILDNDALTRGLGDPEARVLIEWLVEQAERLAASPGCEQAADAEIRGLCQRARGLGRFVSLWCCENRRGAAVQLAACERFTWPLPTGPVDPCELMQVILFWEERSRQARAAAAA
jgi:hypothetical protein